MRNAIVSASLALLAVVFTAGGVFAQQLGQGNTVYDVIKNDHKVITDDFNKVEQTSDNAQKKAAFDTLRKDLFAHMRAEETTWYPKLQENTDTKALAGQAQDEHVNARADIEKIYADWNNQQSLLSDAKKKVDDHVKFEEGKMFDASRKIIGSDEESRVTAAFKDADKA
ncbi:MAG: hemerythrin domain-containing protein [Deltaproteobacteria bacterium]